MSNPFFSYSLTSNDFKSNPRVIIYRVNRESRQKFTDNKLKEKQQALQTK